MQAAEIEPDDKRIQEDLEQIFIEQEKESPREYVEYCRFDSALRLSLDLHQQYLVDFCEFIFLLYTLHILQTT